MEARATQEGHLACLDPYVGEPGEDDPRIDGVFSVVIDDQTARKRRLPSLYVADYHVFAHRDTEPLYERLERAVKARIMAAEVPTYTMQACRSGDRYGLYIRDFFNREPFRRKLTRLGLEFSRDPYTRLTREGFWSEDWGAMDVSFVLLGNDDSDPEVPVANTPAIVAFHTAGLRIYLISPAEFSQLRELLRGATAIGTGDPSAAMQLISGQAA